MESTVNRIIKNATAKMSTRFYGKSTTSVRTPRTPSPKPGQPPMETNPLEPPRLRRSNAIKRMGEALVNRRREDARAESPTPKSRNQDIDIPPMQDEWTWEDMRRLPGILISFVKSGMPGDELGFYLDKVLYGRDKSLGGIVTTLVNENVQYDDLAARVLKVLDVHDGNGHLLHEQLEPAEWDRRPNRPVHSKLNPGQGLQTPPTSPPKWKEELLSCESPNTTGPEIICPRRREPRHAALERESIQRFLAEAADDGNGGGEQNDLFAEFEGPTPATDGNANANANANTDYDSSSSLSDGVAVQHAQAVQFIKPGPARFYSQFYNNGGTTSSSAAAAAAADTSIRAMHANRNQHSSNGSSIPHQLRPGGGVSVQKWERKFSRFPID